METLTLDVRDGVAWCTLDGPALNALDTAMFTALLDTAEALRERSDVRVAVITGAGRAFCSGQNLKTFTEEVLDSIEVFIEDPLKWSAEHGGAGELDRR